MPFDAERREAELYDAIYGQRTGTVENITPLARAAPGQQGRRGVEPARR